MSVVPQAEPWRKSLDPHQRKLSPADEVIHNADFMAAGSCYALLPPTSQLHAMFCARCGSELPDGSGRCPRCPARIDHAAVAGVLTPPPMSSVSNRLASSRDDDDL